MSTLKQKFKSVVGYKCDFCSHKTSTIESMEIHLLRHCKHEEELVVEMNYHGGLCYRCPICDCYIGYCEDDKLETPIKNIEDLKELLKVVKKFPHPKTTYNPFFEKIEKRIKEHNNLVKKRK